MTTFDSANASNSKPGVSRRGILQASAVGAASAVAASLVSAAPTRSQPSARRSCVEFDDAFRIRFYTQKVGDVEVFYREVGAKDAPVLLLLHGFPTSSHMFRNLMPLLAQVAAGRRPYLTIFGDDYDTSDGTGVRDYIHVMDLAAGHLRALEALDLQNQITVNLGTGRGASVLDLVRAFSEACGKHIPTVFAPRRQGDVPSCYACPDLAHWILGWRATRDLNETWRARFPCPNQSHFRLRRRIAQQRVRDEVETSLA